jgi:predicted deacylase
MGTVDEVSVGLVERGVSAVLRHLGMRDDGPVATEPTVWVDKDEVLRASHTGLFYPAVVKGQHVTRGDGIGHITDFHGKTLESIKAPFDGDVMYVVATPPISKGEPLAMIGTSTVSEK